MFLGEIAHWSLLMGQPFRQPASVLRYQDQRVRYLLRHAWKNVPYYRRLMEEARVHPDSIRGVADLERLPVSRRVDLQALPLVDRIAAGTNPADCLEFGTSGSTGRPLRLLRTQREQTMLIGFRLRAQVLSGLRPWHTRVNLGAPPKLTLMHRLGVFRIQNLPLDLSLDEIVPRLQVLQPDVLKVVPGMLEPMLRRFSVATLRGFGVRLLFSGAESLTRPLHEEAEAAFGCPLVDLYGSTELNLMAWECRHCGQYHTVDDNVVVEVLRDGADRLHPARKARSSSPRCTCLPCRSSATRWATSCAGRPRHAAAASGSGTSST